jgi:uncharacterized protein (DUF1800 family)
MVRPVRFRWPRVSGFAIAGVALVLTDGGTSRLRAQDTTTNSSTPAVYELVARESNMCADVQASQDTAALAGPRTCDGGESQQWRLERTADGFYRIVPISSGVAMDTAAPAPKETADVVSPRVPGMESQQWRIDPTGDGYFRIVERSTGRALDLSRANIEGGVTQAPDGGRQQQWLFRRVSEPRVSRLGPTLPLGPRPSTADVVRFLEQATFGPTPQLVEHVRRVGFARFLDDQFAAPMSSYPTLPLYPTTRDLNTCPNGSTCVRDNYTMYPVQNRFFVNALYGGDQLRQRVAFALHQMLVVSGVDITQPSWMTPYLQMLDRNAFGSYRQLLLELTLNPAMGNYLDVNGNTRTRPNENYAREILQLFSIGTVQLNLDGTQQLDASGQPIPAYTQATVNEFARVFTGWRFNTAPATGVPNYLDPMVPNEPQHDPDAKTLLNGQLLPPGLNTRTELNLAIDNIVNHPNVGPFVSKQLIQHLVTSNPTPGYVQRVASVFNGGGGVGRGNLRAVVRAILLDPEARGDAGTVRGHGHLRHPALYIAGMLRAFNARSADGAAPSDGYLNPQSTAMGMDVFRPPSVFSYFSPSTVAPGTGGLRGPEFGIYSTSSSLTRINFVNTMVFSRINVSANAPRGTSLDLSPLVLLASNPPGLADHLNVLLLHGSMSTAMRNSIIGAVNAVPATNGLKRARTAAYLVLSSSQYQVER